MSERFDLQKMLLAIQDDEAIDIAEATRLSQDQIQKLVTRREAPDKKQESKLTMYFCAGPNLIYSSRFCELHETQCIQPRMARMTRISVKSVPSVVVPVKR